MVTLYTRVDCHLCEEAKEVIDEVQRERPFELVVLDVDDDPALLALYDHEVPVIAVDGRKAFKFRVSAAALRRKLEKAEGR